MNNFEHNRESWNELTTLHADSSFYDIDSFKQGKTSLNHIEIEELGNIKGKKILHLQCHFGMDTISLARLGAEVVGVDISDTSIQKAIELSNELEVPARFVRSNIYDIENVLDETFDIVYTSYGAINWLNDLDKWAKIIKRYLKPNGIFYMVEFHPLCLICCSVEFELLTKKCKIILISIIEGDNKNEWKSQFENRRFND